MMSEKISIRRSASEFNVCYKFYHSTVLTETIGSLEEITRRHTRNNAIPKRSLSKRSCKLACKLNCRKESNEAKTWQKHNETKCCSMIIYGNF